MHRIAAALSFAAVVWTLTPAAAAGEADVVVQAGHEGRPASCAEFPARACNLGAGHAPDREAAWTSVVADAAAAALRAHGLRVLRRPADYHEHDTARAYVAIHFDGAAPPCNSGASVGFPGPAEAPFAAGWERLYRARYPFRWAGSNITSNEEHYYGFNDADAPGRRMLVELGEITCPAQAAWLRPRLRELGGWIATYVASVLTDQPA